jgi:uncharacterized membrane protein
MLSILLAETEEELAPLIAPPWVFALIAAVIFITLAFVSWSYRDVAHRHNDKTRTDDAPGHGHH